VEYKANCLAFITCLCFEWTNGSGDENESIKLAESVH
jgi:hypothetical protein